MAWHLLFDGLAWLAALATARLVRTRWLPAPAETRDLRYIAMLTGGAALGAYSLGTWNLVLAGEPRIGRSVLGALLGGALAVEVYKKAAAIERPTGPIWALPCAVGIAVGRIGCQLDGLHDATFGVPSALPWALALEDGVPRHPVALYEAATMASFAAVLAGGLARRRPWATERGFALFCAVYGLQRLGWEALKPLPALVGPLSLMQLACLALLGYAGWLLRGDIALPGVELWRRRS